jgi:hypothetical protein
VLHPGAGSGQRLVAGHQVCSWSRRCGEPRAPDSGRGKRSAPADQGRVARSTPAQ